MSQSVTSGSQNVGAATMTVPQSTVNNLLCKSSASNVNNANFQTSTNDTTSLLSVTTNTTAIITALSGSNAAVIPTIQTAPVASASGHQSATTSATNVTKTTQTVTASQINMTPEETNFLRFTSLVLKIAPRAVRREFDMRNHPDGLN